MRIAFMLALCLALVACSSTPSAQQSAADRSQVKSNCTSCADGKTDTKSCCDPTCDRCKSGNCGPDCPMCSKNCTSGQCKECGKENKPKPGGC